jgi:hypothetical protein
MGRPAQLRRFWTCVVEMGCIVRECWMPPQIAHVVGKPSVTERIKEPKPKGKKLQRHDWLVVGCCHQHHSVARDALDNNAAAFEAKHGPVAAHIDKLAAATGLDLWALSQEGRKV